MCYRLRCCIEYSLIYIQDDIFNNVQYRESFDTNEINGHIENNLFSLIKNQNEIVPEEKN
jgi:hypothetical protein